MSTFIAVDKKIMAIDEFDPELTDGYENYEWPAACKTLGDNIPTPTHDNMRLVSIMITPGFIVKCVMDTTAMNLNEDDKIKVILAGAKPACIINPETKSYVFYQAPLKKKFNAPRVMMGINGALVAVIAGFFLAIIMAHQNLDQIQVIVEGLFTLLCISGLIYSAYYYFNENEADQKLRLYLKKIL
jgi:hypothetical protein